MRWRRLWTMYVAAGLLTIGGAAPDGMQRSYKTGEPGVVVPKLVSEVKPRYTKEALGARIQGTVRVEAVVLANGRVGDVRVTRSLDAEHGLDDQAVSAVKGWRFKPDTRKGKPVPVRVEIELTFTLKDRAHPPASRA